ncbi:hypothetical protein BDU57DRAFT_516034 [Ampelomyces quisqualis]|uniref:Uncharacterized protein n=1 Tax=Ampelomyces quisqualis TaxID=50730 RepID=A0A6A5QMV8_AMPQU|nr:hypothetical protein BDU57DRAFT_516034 [Ampelomyces quisqualis]
MASNSRTFGPSSTVADFPKFSSFTNDRHITLSPLSMKRAARDRDRPAHLPSYFIRTPYPFTAKKEFPKPKSRPRQRAELEPPHLGGLSSLDRLDSGYDDTDSQKEYDVSKGKHVLGLVPSQGNYDLRSRLERNEEAQGVVRTRADSAGDDHDSTIWLSLQNNRLQNHRIDGKARKIVKVIVPGSLTINSPVNSHKEKGNAVTVDFDDKFFAERLREEYRTLAGHWFRRALSARKLKAIRLGRVHTWSGASYPPSRNGASGLLAAGAGIDVDDDTRSPFTEHNLMTLYHRPTSGRARYTWVHWAQRVAASNDASSSSKYHRRARSLDNDPFRFPQPVEFSAANEVPEFITTIQFVQAFSALRITTALALMLMLSVAAVLLWVFVGSPGTGGRSGVANQRSDRVGSAVAIGILVLLLESMGFGAWVWCS